MKTKHEETREQNAQRRSDEYAKAHAAAMEAARAVLEAVSDMLACEDDGTFIDGRMIEWGHINDLRKVADDLDKIGMFLSDCSGDGGSTILYLDL